MLRTYFQETFYDMDVEIARKYAEGIKAAIVLGQSFEGEKKQGFFISKKRGFEDKLYIGNIHRIENRLEWNGEELAEDDEIINVVVIDGPVTRDGDGCSYGSKDHRDQIMYANMIPQVVGHIFIINTPGGAASARIDYEQAIAHCREKGKPTVAWVDGMCCSAGQLIASLCDRTIAMNGRDTMGCIGTMCAFWGVANGTVDSDGYRYIELVSVTSPDKNAEYREACDGKTEKLQAELDSLGEEFRQTVKANRPLVKEEHLTGKTFDAQDVMGALVDEIGDYNRAIECVFELANETLPAARTIEPEADDPGTVEETEQPQNNSNMEKEEMKAAEAAAAQAATQEAPAAEATETVEQPAAEEATEQEGTAAQAEESETTEEPTSEETDGGEEATEAPAPTEETAEEAETTEESAGEEAPAAEEAPAEEEKPADGAPAADATGTVAEEAIAGTQAEIDKIQETLQNAETMIAEKDKTIADMQAVIEKNTEDFTSLTESFDQQSKTLTEARSLIAERDKTIAELQATIEAQKKQLAEKEAEIKELADKPAPMTDGAAGIPADNGTGEAPKQKQSKFRRGMSYKEYRAAING